MKILYKYIKFKSKLKVIFNDFKSMSILKEFIISE